MQHGRVRREKEKKRRAVVTGEERMHGVEEREVWRRVGKPPLKMLDRDINRGLKPNRFQQE